MKKNCMRMLAMILCLLLTATAAAAQSGTIMPEKGEENNFLGVRDMATAGGYVYLLAYGYSNGQPVLWKWQEGMEQAVPVDVELLRGDDLIPGFGTVEGTKYALSFIAADGERLFGVNPASGLVFEILVSEEGVHFADVVTLQDTSAFYHSTEFGKYYTDPRISTVSGDYLYCLCTLMDEKGRNSRICCMRYSLVDGSAHEVPVDRITVVCAGPEGKLFVVSRPVSEAEDTPEQPYLVSLYDPLTDVAEPVAEIDTTRSIGNLTYAPALDALLWQEGTNIMGMQGLGEEQLFAYVPTTSNGYLTALGETLVLARTALVVARELVPGLTVPESLQIMHASFDAAATDFMELYPDVPLEMINEQAEEGFEPWLNPVNGGQRVDVLRLYTDANRQDFEALRDAGLLMDLSADPEVAAYVADLYPAFRDLVTGDNGEIWAIPTETVDYTGFFVNRKAMTAMGFRPEDMPTNLVELCAFITMWDKDYAGRFPNYTCIEGTEDVRRFLADMAVDMWIVHCQATGRPLRFDDPEFRAVMEAIAAVSTERSDASMLVTNPEISEYKSGLFWWDCQLVGNWASYMEPYSDRIFVPLSLTADVPFHAEVQSVELWAVNRQSESTEYAIRYILQQMANVSDKYAHVLLTSRTEPVENPSYAESLAYEQRGLGELQMLLLNAATPEQEATLRQQIEAKEQYIAMELPRKQYTITPSAIANYVDVLAPATVIRGFNLLQGTSEGRYALEHTRDRWLNGEITTEQFIREIDTRIMMLEMAQ